jgi:hypothetical protein
MGWVSQGDRAWYEEGEISFRDQWAYYETHPPRLLASFRADRIVHAPIEGGGHGEAIQINYAVSCTCGSPDLNLEATFVSGDYSYWASPVFCHCKACGARELLFDLRQHGNDAENGFAPKPRAGEKRVAEFAASDQLIVSFYFPDDAFTFGREAFARGEAVDGPRPEDCFSWIRFTRLNSKKSESIADFECA